MIQLQPIHVLAIGFLILGCSFTEGPIANAFEPTTNVAIQDTPAVDLQQALRGIDPKVAAPPGQQVAPATVAASQRTALGRVNQASSAAWRTLQNRDDWERFRREKINALSQSLALPQKPAGQLATHVIGQIAGDGFTVERLVYESRPGWWVTANRYLPTRPVAGKNKAPAILIAHAHHTPKDHSELQDMGMTWARAGAVVLVPDQLGHGERRQHGIASQEDGERAIRRWEDANKQSQADASFRLSRQDYYSRYDNSLRLYLAGESLMGWMVWDLMRGVEVLRSMPQVEGSQIALLGAVAGGGDPAAVTAALDDRIAVAAPFNFGGPQPETRFPLPDDAEATFGYAGSGSWESTRNIARSAADGFLPWVIVGSIAPRKLIFAHEFNWDRPRDPVWKRLETIYQWHDALPSLAFTHGKGELKQSAPEASHCTHIGPLHRVNIHASLGRWFDWQVSPADEYHQPVTKSDLQVWDQASRDKLQPQSLGQVLGSMVDRRLTESRVRRAKLPPGERTESLKKDLGKLFGWQDAKEATAASPATAVEVDKSAIGEDVQLERLVIPTADGISIPLLILSARGSNATKSTGRSLENSANGVQSTTTMRPLVIGIAHGGKAHFLTSRTGDLEKLLKQGCEIVLPDLRGLGQGREEERRGRGSSSTSRWATALMLGEPPLAQRSRDLQHVLDYLATRYPKASHPVLLWGDSAVRVNPPDDLPVLPHDAARQPQLANADGPSIALLAALLDRRVAGVYTRGAIADWRSVIDHAQVHVPADLIAPGWLTVTDTDDLCAVLAPRPLAILQPLDGRNRAVGSERLAKLLTLTQAAYRSAKTAGGDSNSSSSAAPVSDDTSSGKEKSNSLQLTEIDIADWVKQILPSLQTPDKERKTEVSQ